MFSMSATDMPAALLFFLSTGFAVGFGHCIGMCGPIVVAMSLQSPGQHHLLRHLLYNTGRITTYTLLGGIVGVSGSLTRLAAHTLGLQKAVMVGTGLMIIATGLAMAGWLPMGRLFPTTASDDGFVARGYRRLIRASRQPATCFPLGLLLGLLPCGPIYTALLSAARLAMENHNPIAGFLTGASAMCAFGLGTFPALIIVARMTSVRWIRSRALIYRIGAILITLFGGIFVFQGIRM